MTPLLQMVVDDVAAKTPKKPAHRRKGSEPTTRVTQSTFSPMSARLANVGRVAVRVGIATEEGFPSDHKGFAWKAITDAMAVTEVPGLAVRFAKAGKSDERRGQLTNYVRSVHPIHYIALKLFSQGLGRCPSGTRRNQDPLQERGRPLWDPWEFFPPRDHRAHQVSNREARRIQIRGD